MKRAPHSAGRNVPSGIWLAIRLCHVPIHLFPIDDRYHLLDLPPSQNTSVEMRPTNEKKTMGSHFPCRTLRAASRAMMTQLLANLQTRLCSDPPAPVPDVRPTATDASTPITAATYNHSSLAGIIDRTSATAMANGVQGINR